MYWPPFGNLLQEWRGSSHYGRRKGFHAALGPQQPNTDLCDVPSAAPGDFQRSRVLVQLQNQTAVAFRRFYKTSHANLEGI